MAYTAHIASWAMPKRRPLFDWVKALFKSRHKERADQLDYEYLLRSNDHMLKDIGLTCDDVKEALNRPRRWL